MSKLISFFCAFALLLSFSAQAADERFTVEIKVDVTDENASIAREKAMTNATRAAVTAVAGRISTQDGVKRISAMTDAQLINFIKETSVISEQNSAVRYIADLRIIVNEDLLKEYMKERNIPLISRNNSSIMVIPLFREFSDDTPLLWEVDNPWKQAWDNSGSLSAVKIFPIQSSSGNTEALDAVKAATIDTTALSKVMRMSGASDVYVLDATYDGVEGLKIDISSLSGKHQTLKVAGAKSSGAALFNQAVTEVRQLIEQLVLDDTAQQIANESELTILYPFSSLGRWIEAEQNIKSLPEVAALQVQAMAQGKAQFKIRYRGDLGFLQRQLLQKGYRLENGGNYMILRNIGE